jgi:hypothetical protein
MRKFHFIAILSLAVLGLGFIDSTPEKEVIQLGKVKTPEFLLEKGPWIDSVINSLTLEEKIAQLIMYPVYTRDGEKEMQKIESLIDNYNIGGVIYMQGGPARQVNAHNRLMARSKTPLLTSIDGVW